MKLKWLNGGIVDKFKMKQKKDCLPLWNKRKIALQILLLSKLFLLIEFKKNSNIFLEKYTTVVVEYIDAFWESFYRNIYLINFHVSLEISKELTSLTTSHVKVIAPMYEWVNLIDRTKQIFEQIKLIILFSEKKNPGKNIFESRNSLKRLSIKNIFVLILNQLK